LAERIDLLLLAAFLAVVIVLLVTCKRAGASWLEPGPIFLVGWAVIAGFLSTTFVVYDQIFTGVSFFSLVFGISAFVIAALTMRMRYRRRHPQAASAARPTIAVSSWTLIFSGSIVYLALEAREIIEFFAAGGFDASSLVDLREEHTLRTLEAQATPASIGKAAARVAATLAAVGIPVFWRSRNWLLICVGAAAIVALFAESLLAGGRVMLAYVALGALYIFVHQRRATDSRVGASSVVRFVFAGLILLAMSYGMLVVFPAARNPALIDNVDFFLSYLHDARVSEWVYRASERSLFAALPVFAFASSYLSQPIVKYSFFLEHGRIDDWYYLGSYNFPLLGKIGAALTDSRSSWAEIRAEIASVSTRFGYAENPWATGARDLVIDFGLLGMVLAMFLFGAAWQWLFERARISAVVEWQIVLALAMPMAFFFVFFSPFPIGVFSNTLVTALALALMRSLTDTARRGPGVPAAGAGNAE